MLEATITLVVAGAIVLPHGLPLHRVAPRTAATVWLLALMLRALVGMALAIFVLVYLPQSALFQALARWCLHSVAPLLTSTFGVSGHSLADAAILLPALALSGSLVWLVFGTCRAALALRLYLRCRTCGEGPMGSTVVDDADVVVAVTSLGRARLVVSQAALGAMDEEELAASLAHELGHLRCRHRPILQASALCVALGRILPGTGVAQRSLAFHLERQADDYAVRTTRDPLALASAICKAADPNRRNAFVVPLGGRGSIVERLDYLVDGGGGRTSPTFERLARLLAVGMAMLMVALSVTLPTWALATPASGVEHSQLVCRHT